MPDKLSPDQRHRNMAAIRGKNTKPEIIVRKFLWNNGVRYRLNHRRLPGKPDIVLRKYKTCIFVNGCFWHGHNIKWVQEGGALVQGEVQEVQEGSALVQGGVQEVQGEVQEGSKCCKIPQTNREFWVKKIARNQQRDSEVKARLNAMGWHCITIWECELKPSCREATLRSLLYTLSKIFLDNHRISPFSPEAEGCEMVAENE